MEDDGGYAAKVMAEHDRLRLVAAGRSVPVLTPQVVPVKAAPMPKPDTEAVASIVNS
jgi:hypothetical protein